MITMQHADSQKGQESPGPLYKHIDHLGRLKSTVGKQGATFKFGTGGRKDMNSEPGSSGTSSTYREVPGPGTYACSGSVGKQVASRAATAPTFKFGTSDRAKQKRGAPALPPSKKKRSKIKRDKKEPCIHKLIFNWFMFFIFTVVETFVFIHGIHVQHF